MQSIIEEICHNLIDVVTLCLQKEKKDNIQEGHQNILEEVKLHQENVHAKYDGIISKARVIKDQAKMIKDAIVFENKMDEMRVKNEEKPSNVKPYRHPHYQERFQGKKKININIIKEEDGILINIDGIWHHKTIISEDIIRDQQPLQIGEATTKIHEIKGNKIMPQLDNKD